MKVTCNHLHSNDSVAVCSVRFVEYMHYENTPNQIYRKFHLQKLKKIQIKTLVFFIFLLET